ncbi:MAG: MlaD family protein [Endozoicomonas sp.]
MSVTGKAKPVYAGIFVVVMIALAVVLSMVVGEKEFSGNNKIRYEVIYDTSIMGLNVGAPVTLRGVKIGEVSSIRAKLFNGRNEVMNSVYIDIYPDTVVRDDELDSDNLMAHLIEQGLGVKLRTQSLLTGLLYMEVDFYSAESRLVPVETRYPQIPTVPTDLESFSQGLEDMNLPELVQDMRVLIASLSRVTTSNEFQQIPANLNVALSAFQNMSIKMGQSMTDMRNEFVPMSQNMNTMSVSIEERLPETVENLNRVLKGVEKSLQSLDQTTMHLGDSLAPDSPLVYQLQRSSRDIGKSARAVQRLADMLEEQPRSVWSGKNSQ